ncbi:4Fe-4S dicluster domain-containing protein [Candidatus Contubernalis alkaliaceticus]|uniref:hypothetical protein n=1 Tax=Candidatus Contubernalis alkaliaceticus TaxID=338645 RepID=UPI001F4C2680|nr:hypothetical protein [Candidatus Contubernalis alkalaceticus]UNC93246.1 hypothetical protein HUE98_14820 [Candidatus Contubernalis alkalaceticus]
MGAITFGDRDELISKGESRVNTLIDKGRDQANLYGAEGTGVLLVLDYDPSDYELPDESSLAGNMSLPSFASPAGGLTIMAALGGLGLSCFRKLRTAREDNVE